MHCDQTMKWLYAHSHLLLETDFIRPATINALTNWFNNHSTAHLEDLKKCERIFGPWVENPPISALLIIRREVG